MSHVFRLQILLICLSLTSINGAAAVEPARGPNRQRSLADRASDKDGTEARQLRNRKLPTKFYKIGMDRPAVEKRLNLKIVDEFDVDHGFGVLRDVYYDL